MVSRRLQSGSKRLGWVSSVIDNNRSVVRAIGTLLENEQPTRRIPSLPQIAQARGSQLWRPPVVVAIEFAPW